MTTRLEEVAVDVFEDIEAFEVNGTDGVGFGGEVDGVERLVTGFCFVEGGEGKVVEEETENFVRWNSRSSIFVACRSGKHDYIERLAVLI